MTCEEGQGQRTRVFIQGLGTVDRSVLEAIYEDGKHYGAAYEYRGSGRTREAEPHRYLYAPYSEDGNR